MELMVLEEQGKFQEITLGWSHINCRWYKVIKGKEEERRTKKYGNW